MTEAYRELGWEYVCTLAGTFHVWRCEDPDAPELDTDPVVQGMGYRYLKRKMLRRCVVDGLLLAALAALWVWVFASTSTPLLDTLEAVPGRILVGLITWCLIIAVIICEARSMRSLLRLLSAGIPLDRPRPYRRQKWLARGLMAGMVFIWLTMLFGSGRTIDGGSLERGWDNTNRNGTPKEGAVYVDLADLEGAADTDFWGSRTKFQELCPRMYVTRQLSMGPEEEDPQPGDPLPVRSSVETTYYRMLTEGLARRLEKELIQRRIASLGVDGHPVLTAAEADALDGFWWGEDRYYQFTVARLGRQVLFVQYEGDTDLRAREDYFASLLS